MYTCNDRGDRHILKDPAHGSGWRRQAVRSPQLLWPSMLVTCLPLRKPCLTRDHVHRGCLRTRRHSASVATMCSDMIHMRALSQTIQQARNTLYDTERAVHADLLDLTRYAVVVALILACS